jgi:nucleoside-diphosphate-sugar epimerase
MIYLTGASGLIGKRFREICNKKITFISYRDEVEDVFKSHDKSCLIHLGWSSTTRDTDEEKVRKDVWNSQHLFEYYAKKNPQGKIIFVSTAGDMHLDNDYETVSEISLPNPRTLYGRSKLHVEQVLKSINCKTVILRTSNVWGGDVNPHRVNGLVDKLRVSLNTDNIVEVYADLDTRVDLIHVNDFIDLLIKVVETDIAEDHSLFLVGGQSISLCDIINRVSKHGCLNLKIDQKAEKTYLRISSTKAQITFDWKRKYYL